MDITIYPSKLSGRIAAIPSKSDLHRALICAAFSDADTDIALPVPSAIPRDVLATIRCLETLGAKIRFNEAPDAELHILTVSPVRTAPDSAALDCGESGSTMRFLMPAAAALCKTVTFTGGGRLPQRPLMPLPDILRQYGCTFSSEHLPVVMTGCTEEKLAGPPVLSAAGDISSQPVSGLLLASPLMGGIHIRLTSEPVSAPYISMTCEVMRRFGVNVVQANSREWTVEAPGKFRYHTPGFYNADADWSNAAFFIAADVLSGAPAELFAREAAGAYSPDSAEHVVTITGLRENSPQGDKQILYYASEFARRRQAVPVHSGRLKTSADSTPVQSGRLEILADSIPDLIPVLAVLAALTPGETYIHNAGRLRFKESDRIRSVKEMLFNLGADIKSSGGDLLISGKKELRGGTVSSYNDHRIAMAAAIASIGCVSPVKIIHAEAVAKSYPAFWTDFVSLGGKIDKETGAE